MLLDKYSQYREMCIKTQQNRFGDKIFCSIMKTILKKINKN